MFRIVHISRAGSVTLALAVSLLASGVRAEESTPLPVQLAIWNPLQVFDSQRSILGLRYSLIYGVNQDVSGLDISTGMTSTKGDFAGVQIGAFNIIDGIATGLQFGVFGSDTRKGEIRGVQVGLLAGSFSGDVTGLQLSLGGNSGAETQGAQLGGFFNAADKAAGIKVGV